MAGLLEPGQIINIRTGGTQAKLPAMIGGQRQDPAQPPGAETIRIVGSTRRQRKRELVSAVGGLRMLLSQFDHSLTVMLFSTSVTPLTFLARSPARFFWSLVLTKPLN